jgi:hypothetical protein
MFEIGFSVAAAHPVCSLSHRSAVSTQVLPMCCGIRWQGLQVRLAWELVACWVCIWLFERAGLLVSHKGKSEPTVNPVVFGLSVGRSCDECSLGKSYS